jgi:4-hydroxy-3-polyprenylbenzoate decarboxylase
MATAISSGSFITSGMIVAPCSTKTLSGIARAAFDDLIARAADVCPKERRRSVLMARETPLIEIHLQDMITATRAGAISFPPVFSGYGLPRSVDDSIEHLAVRALDPRDCTSSTWPAPRLRTFVTSATRGMD